MSKLLEIENLKTSFFTVRNELPIIRGISLSIEKGKILALVGESGCGKTMTALSILRLLPQTAKIISGSITFDGRNLLDLTEKQMQKIRGKEISLIFQEPGIALNPVYTIGNQIGEVIKLHGIPLPSGERTKVRGENVKQEIVRLLDIVKIPSPEQRLKSYPHELSGGMQQRALIAMAIAAHPKLLIADEPTTALDVTVQAQILMLIKELVNKLDMSVLLITHDLGIVAEVADNVAVMYAGKIVEYANVYELFKNPLHPYTKGLINSIPKINSKETRLQSISGTVPDIGHLPNGCSFQPRCSPATEQCKTKEPMLRELSPEHWVSCDTI